MDKKTIDLTALPDWAYSLLRGVYHLGHDWYVGVAVILTATLLSLAVFLINKHYTASQQRKIKSSGLHLLLVGITGLFTALQYFIPFMQQNLVYLQHVPYVGVYMLSVYSAANFLFNLKYEVWFKQLFATAQKQADTTVVPTVAVPTVTPTEPTSVVSARDF